MTTARAREMRASTGTGRGALLLVLLAGALALLSGCEEGTGREPARATPDAGPGAGGPRIAALVGLPDGIDAAAVSPSGARRPVREGDVLAAGEALETGPRCEAVVALDGGTTVQLGGDGRIAFPDAGAGRDLDLVRGAIAVARPGTGRPFAVKRGGETIAVPGGRSTIAADERARLSDWVAPLNAGERRFDGGGEPLRGIGTLTARLPGTGQRSEEALELASHDVRVLVRDGVAETRIEEAFVNRSGRTVEATYRFVLPSSASITRLALDVDGRTEEGEVLERARARRIFREIVEDSVRPRDPALLEWERGSTFTMKIFPIRPGETRRVFLSYMEPLLFENGVARYVYPLGGPAGAPTAGRFSIGVDIRSALGIAWVATPLYPTEVRAAGDAATASFSAERFAPRLDFAVEFGAAKAPPEMRVAVQTGPTGASHAMLIAAPAAAAAPPPVKRRLLAVVDTSYGADGALHDLAAATVLELFAGLGPGDGLNALACDSGCRTLSQRFEAAGPAALDRAREFFDDNPPGGASDVLGALSRAFALASDGAPATIVYIGDGVPTAGETSPARIVDLLSRTAPPNVRVDAVGLGPNVDALLLGAIADALGGTSAPLSVGESPARAARDLSRRLWAPGLSNVSIAWPAGVRAAHPQRVGFAPQGAEIAFFAELDGDALEGEVVLSGAAAGGARAERRFPVSARSPDREAGFIGRLFAKERIDHLELAGGAKGEIVDLSRRMRVASRETSWIVLENQRMYDRFGVQRTAAGEWDGEAPGFTKLAAEEPDDEEGGDLDALASLGDALEADGSAAPLGRMAGGGGSGKADFDEGAAPAKTADAAYPRAEESEKRARRDGQGAEIASAAKPAAPAQVAGEPVGGLGTGYGYGPQAPWDDRYRRCSGPGYDVRITAPAAPSARAAYEVKSLEADLRARPLSRAAHRRYVAALSRLGRVDEALAAADAWRAADPLDATALAAYGDQLARLGDRRAALRAYASIAEVDPARAAHHSKLARAFEALGAFDAAASHHRAAAALDAKGRGASTLRYLYCLAAAGMRALLEIEAAAALDDPALRKIRDDAIALLAGARTGVLPEQEAPKARGELLVTLEAGGGEDLDLAVLDPAGRRVSGLWQRKASAAGVAEARGESLALDSLSNGRYRILVSRTRGARGAPAGGTVTIRVRGERRSFPFTIPGAEAAVADVTYRKIDPPPYCR